MKRKFHVRFGGGRLEKEAQAHLVSRLPDELDAEDWARNSHALENDLRLLSSYRLRDNTKVWVITEWDRSSTTLLLPEEY